MNLTGQPFVVAGRRETRVSAVVGVFLRIVVALVCGACLVSCKPQPESIVVVHEGLAFAWLVLADQNQVNAPEFEKKLRLEFGQFAKDIGIPFVDDTEGWQKLEASYVETYKNDPEKLKTAQNRTRVSIGAHEKEVSISVSWQIGPEPDNSITFWGNGKDARPRQVFDALVQRLRSRNIPFEVKKSPSEMP